MKRLKYIIVVLLALSSFGAAVVLPLMLTGKFNTATFKKIFGVEQPKPAEQNADKPDDMDEIVAALKKREEEVAKREQKVREDEEQLKKMQADLETLREEVQNAQIEIESKLSAENDEYRKRLQDVANSVSKMKPTNAAASLLEMSPQDAAAVLRLVKERDRGKILDAMGDKAGPLLQALQDKRL